MKSSILFVCLLAALFLPIAPLAAQDTLMYHLGAGVSVEPALFGQNVYYTGGTTGVFVTATPIFSVSPFYVYMPVTLTKNFRLEPRFGIYSFSNEISNSATPSQPQKFEVTLTNIGLSVEYVIPTGEKFQFYVGPRGSLNFISETFTSYQYTGGPVPVNVTTAQSETDFMISGIFGAEYFPLKELSVGGEVDFNYVSFGNPDITQTPPPTGTQSTTTVTSSLVSTGALFFVRWYFL
jgi:hypothetical protein